MRVHVCVWQTDHAYLHVHACVCVYACVYVYVYILMKLRYCLTCRYSASHSTFRSACGRQIRRSLLSLPPHPPFMFLPHTHAHHLSRFLSYFLHCVRAFCRSHPQTFMRDMTVKTCVRALACVYVRDIAPSHAWHNSFTYVTWLLHTLLEDITANINTSCNSFICMTRLVHMRATYPLTARRRRTNHDGGTSQKKHDANFQSPPWALGVQGALWCVFIPRWIAAGMVWLWLVGSIELHIFFAKEPYTRDNILQKRPIVVGSIKFHLEMTYDLWLTHVCDMTHSYYLWMNCGRHVKYVTHMNESNIWMSHTKKWVRSYRMSSTSHIWMRQVVPYVKYVTHMNDSGHAVCQVCHTCEWVRLHFMWNK